MARLRTSGRRYAEAAFQIADRDDAIDAWLTALDAAAEAVSDEHTIRVLQNPAIPVEERERVLASALPSDVPPPARNLVLLLLHRRRIDLLPQVAREYRAIYNKRQGITTALVSSAAPLEADETRAVTRQLEEMTSGKVEIQFAVDPGLLGGIVIRVGDRLIDGSLRGRLERLRGRLVAGTV